MAAGAPAPVTHRPAVSRAVAPRAGRQPRHRTGKLIHHKELRAPAPRGAPGAYYPLYNTDYYFDVRTVDGSGPSLFDRHALLNANASAIIGITPAL
jgi:hypothetical protein